MADIDRLLELYPDPPPLAQRIDNHLERLREVGFTPIRLYLSPSAHRELGLWFAGIGGGSPEINRYCEYPIIVDKTQRAPYKTDCVIGDTNG